MIAVISNLMRWPNYSRLGLSHATRAPGILRLVAVDVTRAHKFAATEIPCASTNEGLNLVMAYPSAVAVRKMLAGADGFCKIKSSERGVLVEH